MRRRKSCACSSSATRSLTAAMQPRLTHLVAASSTPDACCSTQGAAAQFSASCARIFRSASRLCLCRSEPYVINMSLLKLTQLQVASFAN